MIGLKNGTPCHDNGTFVVSPNHGILKTLFNFELSFWPWKSMPEPNVAQNNVAQFFNNSKEVNICKFFFM